MKTKSKLGNWIFNIISVCASLVVIYVIYRIVVTAISSLFGAASVDVALITGLSIGAMLGLFLMAAVTINKVCEYQQENMLLQDKLKKSWESNLRLSINNKKLQQEISEVSHVQ